MRSSLRFRTVRQHPALLAGGILLLGLATVAAIPHKTAIPSTVLGPSRRAVAIVLAVSHSMPAGSTVEPSDLKPVTLKGAPPPGAISSYTDALDHVTTKFYQAGAILSRSGLNNASAMGIVADVLPGQRAFSIRIAEDDIVGGFLQSGDHVDAFATIPGSVFPSKDTGDGADRSQTVLLLQNILVLAVGSNPATRGSVQTDARTVSLSLAPVALAKLALAQRFGKVSLAIRKPGDVSNSNAVAATLGDLVPLAATAAPAQLPTAPSRFSKQTGEILFYSGTRTTSLARGWR